MPNSMALSAHAQRRSQQRGIDSTVIDAVVAYGTEVHHKGATRYYMDKSARRRALRDMGNDEYRRIADRLNVYVVVKGSLIVTVAKLRKRIRLPKPHKPTKHPRARSHRRGRR